MTKYRKGNKLLVIEQDTDCESPREWDNIGTMVCFHSRYNLGDEHNFRTEDFGSWEDIEVLLYKEEKAVTVLPLYLYDHSGISMSTSRNYPFNCRWDSGQVGFIYATQQENMTCEQLTKILRDEVATYDDYLTGNVWGFTLYQLKTCDMGHEHKEHIDSCWGFYGHDIEKNGILENAGITDFEDWEEVQ